MKIVLAIDGSDFSKVAIDELAALPLPAGTEVCILNVFENPMLAAPVLFLWAARLVIIMKKPFPMRKNRQKTLLMKLQNH